MKRVTLLTVAMLFATTLVYAHCGMCKLDKGKKAEDWQQKKIEKMTERLSLTEEQVPQVEALVKEKIEKKKAVKEEARAKMDSIREEYSAKIKALLSDDQKVKYDELKKEREEMREEKKAMKGEGHEHKHKKMDKEDKGSEDKS